MKVLCFGSFVKIISTCKKPGVQNQDICAAALKAVDGPDIVGDHTKISRLHSCVANVPDDAINGAQNCKFENVVNYVLSNIIDKLLAENKIKNIILALKDVVKDSDLEDSVHIGKFTKDELLVMTDIVPAEIITSVLIYVCAEVKNTEGKAYINDITDDYVNNFDTLKSTINIVNAATVSRQALTQTLNKDDFDTIFKEVVGTEKLMLPNYNDIRLYHLDIQDNEFVYDDLMEFLLDNIGYYVYSREEMQRLKDKKKTQSACIRAVRALNEHGEPGEKGTGNDLGEVLVYAFLEDVLGAPKIISKAEIAGGLSSKSDGVHLLKLNDNGKETYQLVFGASDITGNIKAAVNNALLKLEELESKKTQEMRMVNKAILQDRFDIGTTEYLKQLLVPSRNRTVIPDTSYGVFIGYSLGIDPMLYDSNTYRTLAAEKMEKDITDIAVHIRMQLAKMAMISSSTLAKHSLYFYFLPFDNADIDKDNIMKDLLSGGVV